LGITPVEIDGRKLLAHVVYFAGDAWAALRRQRPMSRYVTQPETARLAPILHS
jgi:hypothetical protein